MDIPGKKKVVASTPVKTIIVLGACYHVRTFFGPDGLDLSGHAPLHCFYKQEHSSKIYMLLVTFI